MRASRLIGCNSNAVQPPHINLTASPSQSPQRSGGNVILYCSSFAVYVHKYRIFFSSVVRTFSDDLPPPYNDTSKVEWMNIILSTPI